MRAARASRTVLRPATAPHRDPPDDALPAPNGQRDRGGLAEAEGQPALADSHRTDDRRGDVPAFHRCRRRRRRVRQLAADPVDRRRPEAGEHELVRIEVARPLAALDRLDAAARHADERVRAVVELVRLERRVGLVDGRAHDVEPVAVAGELDVLAGALVAVDVPPPPGQRERAVARAVAVARRRVALAERAGRVLDELPPLADVLVGRAEAGLRAGARRRQRVAVLAEQLVAEDAVVVEVQVGLVERVGPGVAERLAAVRPQDALARRAAQDRRLRLAGRDVVARA